MDGKVEDGVMKEGLEAGLRRAQRWKLCAWKAHVHAPHSGETQGRALVTGK